MTDEADKEEEPKPPPQRWGKRSPRFFAKLKGQTVLVGVSTDVVFKGELIGVDSYDIIIKLDSGTEVLIQKGNLVYVHKAK
jgi:hypothetical protein